MKKIVLLAYISSSIILGQVSSKASGPEKNKTIFLAAPEGDTTYTFSSKYALSASTIPGSKVTVNGKEFKIYPSGAFAGLLSLQDGLNLFSINSVLPSGDTLKKDFIIFRKVTSNTLPADSLAIESAGIEPSKDLWLDAGDVLNVRFKGTPGCKASFMNGIEMRELSTAEANGIGGIYQGVYRIKYGEKLKDESIEFSLTDKSGKTITCKSKGKVTVKEEEFPIVGITKGDRPYLNFGLGEDRLGGAKLGFLCPGVKLKITGKVGNQYKISLAGNQQAWIPEDQVDLLPRGTFLPNSLTSSWSVYGDEKYDYISVSLNERLPFTSIQDPENKRIIVDLHGAAANTNWITQHLTTKEIKNVYYEVPTEGLFRIIIELKHRQNWGYAMDYSGNNFVIKVKHQPEKLKLGSLTFVLDAGHGGANFGAVGATSAREKDINLSTVYQIKELLENEGAKVILTRKDDTYSTNNERMKTILNSNADILISIHSNSIGYSSDPEKVKGISTYYKHICFRPLSTFIYNEVLKTGLEPFGNVGNFNFTLNSPTEIPNALVELGFMSNPEDEMKLLDEDFRKDLSEKIVYGIEEFLDNCKE